MRVVNCFIAVFVVLFFNAYTANGAYDNSTKVCSNNSGDLSKQDSLKVYRSLKETYNVKPSEILFLDLSNNNLTSIPYEVFRFRNLRVLDLSNNQIRKISKEIFNLKNLEYLILKNNRISSTPTLGSISKKIAELDKLEVLDLSKNKLRSIPKGVFELSSLKFLKLSHNNFKKIHMDINKLANLQILHVDSNEISYIPHLTTDKLRILKANNNQLTYDILSSIKKLKELEYLNLNENPIRILTTDLDNNTELKELYISGSSIKKIDCNLSSFANLKAVDLSSNQIEYLPDNFYARKITSLNLHQNRIKKMPENLSGYKELRNLNLANNNIGKIPNNINQLKKLETLNIAANPIVEGSDNFYKLPKIDALIMDDVRYYSRYILDIRLAYPHISQLRYFDYKKRENKDFPLFEPQLLKKIKALRKASFNGDFHAYISLGELFKSMELYDVSETMYESIVKMEGIDNYLQLLNLGNYFNEHGMKQYSKVMFNKIISLDTLFAYNEILSIGAYIDKQGFADVADKMFAKTLELDTITNYEDLLKIGKFLDSYKRTHLATQNYKKIVDLNKVKDYESCLKLGRFFEGANRQDLADRIYLNVLLDDNVKGEKLLISIGNYFETHNQSELAYLIFKRITEYNYDSSDEYFKYAEFFVDHGQAELATAMFEEGDNKISYDGYQDVLKYGKYYQKFGQQNLSLGTYKRLLAMDNSIETFDNYMYLGDYFVAEKNLGLAEKIYKKGINKRSDYSFDDYLKLGRYFNKRKIRSLANEMFNASYENLKVSNYKECLMYAEFYKKQGMKELSHKTYKKTLSLYSGSDIETCLTLGKYFDENKLSELSNEVYSRAYNSSAGYESRLKAGYSLKKRNKSSWANKFFKSVINYNPMPEKKVLEVAKFFQNNQEYTYAVRMYERLAGSSQYQGTKTGMLALIKLNELAKRHSVSSSYKTNNLDYKICQTYPKESDAQKMVNWHCKQCYNELASKISTMESEYSANSSKMKSLIPTMKTYKEMVLEEEKKNKLGYYDDLLKKVAYSSGTTDDYIALGLITLKGVLNVYVQTKLDKAEREFRDLKSENKNIEQKIAKTNNEINNLMKYVK